MLTYNEKKYDERCGENRQNIELIRGRITYETLKKNNIYERTLGKLRHFNLRTRKVFFLIKIWKVS